MSPRELSVVRVRILDALMEGDKTVYGLWPFTFISLKNTREYVRILRRTKEIHVTGWHRESPYGPATPILRVGKGKDAPKPVPLTAAERKRKLRASVEYKEKANSRKRAIRLGKKILSHSRSFVDLL